MTIKILFLAANANPNTKLKLDEEVRDIKKRLVASNFRDKFEFEAHGAVEINDLQGIIRNSKPQIVHFAGHGSSEGEIMLLKPGGQPFPVPVQALAMMFSVHEGVKCVFLNACYSEVQAAAIAKDVDFVIGVTNAIKDNAAIAFSPEFYNALANGASIQKAYDAGTLQIAMLGFDGAEFTRLKAERGEDPKTFTYESFSKSRNAVSGGDVSEMTSKATIEKPANQRDLLQATVKILIPLFPDEQSRRAIIEMAFGGESIVSMVEYSGPANVFTINLISRLRAFDGDSAVVRLLQSLEVGRSFQKDVENLIIWWQEPL